VVNILLYKYICVCVCVCVCAHLVGVFEELSTRMHGTENFKKKKVLTCFNPLKLNDF